MKGKDLESKVVPSFQVGSKFFCIITNERGFFLRVLGPFVVKDRSEDIVTLWDDAMLKTYRITEWQVLNELDQTIPPRHNGTNPPGHSALFFMI